MPTSSARIWRARSSTRGHKGAHDETLLRAPEPAAVERLLDAGRGTVRQVTLAPELPGGLEAIRLVVAAGAAAAVGHTGADAARDRGRLRRRARRSSRTRSTRCPACTTAIPDRSAAAASDPRVTLEVIADGVHLHPEVVRIAFAAAPGRIALVTDAMAAAGHARRAVRARARSACDVVDGVARLAVGGAIAGLDADAGCRAPPHRRRPACRWPTPSRRSPPTPARAIGRGDDLGSLAPGFAADAVLLAPPIASTWTAGDLATRARADRRATAVAVGASGAGAPP